jgi:hypothetical protein
MEAFVVACSLLILASVAFFLILGVRKVVGAKRLGVCARCGHVVEYSRWRTPPWCAACEEEVWRTDLDEALPAGPRASA